MRGQDTEVRVRGCLYHCHHPCPYRLDVTIGYVFKGKDRGGQGQHLQWLQELVRRSIYTTDIALSKEVDGRYPVFFNLSLPPWVQSSYKSADSGAGKIHLLCLFIRQTRVGIGGTSCVCNNMRPMVSSTQTQRGPLFLLSTWGTLSGTSLTQSTQLRPLPL